MIMLKQKTVITEQIKIILRITFNKKLKKINPVKEEIEAKAKNDG